MGNTQVSRREGREGEEEELGGVVIGVGCGVWGVGFGVEELGLGVTVGEVGHLTLFALFGPNAPAVSEGRGVLHR